MSTAHMISLSPQEIEAFISRAALAHELTLDSVRVSSHQILKGEMEISSPSGVHFQLSSGVLRIFSNSAPKATFEVKIVATSDTYIALGESNPLSGTIHLIFNQLDFEMDFTTTTAIQEILETL